MKTAIRSFLVCTKNSFFYQLSNMTDEHRQDESGHHSFKGNANLVSPHLEIE